jgi:peptidoglycan/LPS O-acetylase OafA/YrhL
VSNAKPAITLYFPNLDILRFIAAFYVLAHHCYGYLADNYHLPSFMFSGGQKSPDRLIPLFQYLQVFVKNGPFGVDLFFLISGFLITSLLLHEKALNTKIDIKSFYVRRILRIWPLYYFVIVFAYVFAHQYTGEAFYRKDIYPHLFFVSNFTMAAAADWGLGKLFMLWSLCIEEQFYLVIPLLLALVRVKRLPYVFIGLILLSIGARIVIFKLYQYPWFPLYLHTASRFDTLAIGCLLGYLNYAGFKIHYHPAVRLLLSLGLVITLCFCDVFDYSTLLKAAIGKYLFIVPLSVLFVDFVQNILPVLTNPLWRLLNKLGKYSYGIYMYQVFMIVVADSIAGNYFHRSRLAFLLLSVVITVGISVISYEVFEKHFLKLKRRFEKF